jgi:acetyl-CoA acetyltransferase
MAQDHGWAGRNKVAIVGAAVSSITRRTERPLGGLVREACLGALSEAGLGVSDVTGVATYPFPGYFVSSPRAGVDLVGVPWIVDHLRMENLRWYSESNEGLIGAGIIEGVNAIISGLCDVVVVWRAMSRVSGRSNFGGPRPGTTVSGDAQYTLPYKISAGVITHALAYDRYQQLYGATRAEMATMVLSQRRKSSLNPQALYGDRKLTFDEYMEARMISDPLCLYDCDVPVYGAAAIVLTNAERAKDLASRPAYISGVSINTYHVGKVVGSFYMLQDRMAAGGATAKRLWKTAGVGPADVDVAELYDGFAPSTWYWLEAAGFCGEGEAHQFIQNGTIEVDGALPLNTFGGSLSEGRMHGMGHIIEATRQVTGNAGPRQVKGVELAVVFDGSPLLRGSALALSSTD